MLLVGYGIFSWMSLTLASSWDVMAYKMADATLLHFWTFDVHFASLIPIESSL